MCTYVYIYMYIIHTHIFVYLSQTDSIFFNLSTQKTEKEALSLEFKASLYYRAISRQVRDKQ